MPFWLWGGHYGEGREWLEVALTQEGPTSALARAKALGAASALAWAQGDLVRAEEAAEEGLRLSKEAGIEDSRGPFLLWGTAATFFLNLLAYVTMEVRDHERMAKLGEESLALGRQANNVHGIVGSLLMLAISATLRADYEQAERLITGGRGARASGRRAHQRPGCLETVSEPSHSRYAPELDLPQAGSEL